MTTTDLASLPPPMTAPDVDLRDFQFMPLDVVRLRDSDIAAMASPEEFRSAVMLWCAAWHQIPAASVPDEDKVLSVLAGFGRAVGEWKKVRDGALRGWVKCSDGRLYHPVVAEKANEAMSGKRKFDHKKLCDRLRKAGLNPEAIPSFDAWISDGMKLDDHYRSVGIPLEKALKGQGTGDSGKRQGTGKKEDRSESPSPVPRARDGIEDRTQSRPIIEAFDQALVEVYGEAHRRDWPQQADHVHAQRLVEQGWSVADCKAVFVKSLRQSKELGRKPPGGIAFYEKRFAELKPGAVKPPPNPDAERIDDQWARMLEGWANLPDGARRKTPQPTRDDAEKAVAERRKGAA